MTAWMHGCTPHSFRLSREADRLQLIHQKVSGDGGCECANVAKNGVDFSKYLSVSLLSLEKMNNLPTFQHSNAPTPFNSNYLNIMQTKRLSRKM
jgi:hypothetical protein